jgi:hypothetical protein
VHKAALYEPPLAIDGAPSPMAWVPRYEKALAQGDLAAAMVACIKGTGDPSLFTALPRFILVPLMRLAMRVGAKEVRTEDVSLELSSPPFISTPVSWRRWRTRSKSSKPCAPRCS